MLKMERMKRMERMVKITGIERMVKITGIERIVKVPRRRKTSTVTEMKDLMMPL